MLTRRFVVAQVRDDPRTKARVLSELAVENINLEGYTMHNGDLYLLPDFPGKALEILADLSVTSRNVDLLEIELPNERGALARVFDVLCEADIDVHVSFGFAGAETRGSVFFAVDDLRKAEAALDRTSLRPELVLNR